MRSDAWLARLCRAVRELLLNNMKIFINAKTEEACKVVSSALTDLSADIVLCGSDETAAAEDLSAYDALLVSVPLRSEFGLDFVAEASKRTSAPIIVLASANIAEDVQRRIKFTGAFVLAKPFSRSVLTQTVKMAAVAKENIDRLVREKTELQGKLDDVRIIDRAKCLLIQYLNMTEEQAHKHIQKMAMDTRRSQREVAEDILKTYSV